MPPLRLAAFSKFALVLTGGLLAESAAGAQAPPLPAPRVRVLCSPTRPGTGVVTARLPIPVLLIPATRIDITVFHNGFERSRYARFQPGGGNPVMGDSSDARDDSLPEYRLQVAIAAPPPPPGPGAGPPPPDSAMATVDGLEAGINYTLRAALVSGAGAMYSVPVRVVAPTCRR